MYAGLLPHTLDTGIQRNEPRPAIAIPIVDGYPPWTDGRHNYGVRSLPRGDGEIQAVLTCCAIKVFSDEDESWVGCGQGEGGTEPGGGREDEAPHFEPERPVERLQGLLSVTIASLIIWS
jgi:hypothetical protein